MSTQVKVFDTTLRDGQQCPGAGMTFAQNLAYAALATKLRIDILEAGFPSASSLDFEIVNAIAQQACASSFSPTIAGLCQLREEQVIKTIEALAPVIPAGKGRLHTYVPVDPELMAASLGAMATQKSRIVESIYKLVKIAVEAGLEVQFSPEGYSRMHENFDFTTEAIRAAVEAGASVINCPDTIGGACVFEGKEYFVEKMNEHAAIIAREFPNRDITWSVHCHNDFGLAVQNTINGVFSGPARQIEGCINGIGERAGNAALEQCIMIIKHFGEQNPSNGFHTEVVTEHLQEISNFVSQFMLPRQPHWPVCGDNAVKHSSGGHTNAILKNPLAYQPFDPIEIGRNISFLFGPLSGGNHAKSIIEDAGYTCHDSEKAEVAQFIKDRYKERRKGITDDELVRAYFEFRRPIAVERVDYAKSATRSTVTLHGIFFDEAGPISETHEGKDSALAAVKKAIEKRFGPIEIVNHRSQSEGSGFDARSVSEIIIVDDTGMQYVGVGRDQDIEISAMRALIDATNKAYIEKYYSASRTQAQPAARIAGMKPLSVA
ncbi:MAG: LeuA family protein [Terriglobales bacterium]